MMTRPPHTLSRAHRQAHRNSHRAPNHGRKASFLGVALVAGLSACTTGTYENGHYITKSVDYTLGSPGEGWRQVDIEATNVAWHHPGIGAGLLVNSHCEGVQDAPLVALTNELMIGTTEREILEQDVMPWAGREALETVATAKLDGVLRKRSLFVLKKDGCVYDVVYDAPPERYTQGLAAYEKVRNGLNPGPRRDRG